MSSINLSIPLKTQIKAAIYGIKNLKESRQVTQGDPCWAPPLFPEQGRLPLSTNQIDNNFLKLRIEESQYQRSDIKNRMLCVKSLHISLFFDGTNNNEKNDTKANHPSNIAKLYHASAPDVKEAINKGFYAYYMPGVGTPFPEIGTNEYYSPGLTYSVGGEARVSWALISLCNSLYYETSKKELTLAERRTALKTMSSNPNYHSTTMIALDNYNPMPGIINLLRPIKAKLAAHVPKLTALKLYVYGFSRGAAEARTFVYWLDKLLDYVHYLGLPEIPYYPKGTLYGITVSVEFLGIFDTVAAVGFANVVPIATGHNSWAGGTQQLPKSNLVKQCCHLVAAHEQRQAFALDSVRTPKGIYPPNTVEVIYPGMHSDVGGGYSISDQGKARNSAGELLSQIALHDMYAAAFDAGAPLAISEAIFTSLDPELQRQYAFRKMTLASSKEFDFTPNLVTKFNTWVMHTLPENNPPSADKKSACYTPHRFISHDLERVMEAQLILITAWRIGRYGSAQSAAINLSHQPFFQASAQHTDIKVQPYEAAFSHQATEAIITEYNLKDQELIAIAKERKKEKRQQSDLDNWVSKNIGTPMFDATNVRGQFWEASLEFKADYEDHPRPAPLIDMSSRKTQAECIRDTQQWIGIAASNSCASLPKYSFPMIAISGQATLLQNLDGSVEEIAYAITYQDERAEYKQLKQVSTQLFQDVFSPYFWGITNKNLVLDDIISLFDDHIHDSRAWFMHSESGIREPFGGYFLSRMIYFGDNWNKSMTLIIDDEKVVQSSFSITPTTQLALYYLPTYGLQLINQQTGETASFDRDIASIKTHKIMTVIRPIIERNQQIREANIQRKLTDFLIKDRGKVLTLD